MSNTRLRMAHKRSLQPDWAEILTVVVLAVLAQMVLMYFNIPSVGALVGNLIYLTGRMGIPYLLPAKMSTATATVDGTRGKALNVSLDSVGQYRIWLRDEVPERVRKFPHERVEAFYAEQGLNAFEAHLAASTLLMDLTAKMEQGDKVKTR